MTTELKAAYDAATCYALNLQACGNDLMFIASAYEAMPDLLDAVEHLKYAIVIIQDEYPKSDPRYEETLAMLKTLEKLKCKT